MANFAVHVGLLTLADGEHTVAIELVNVHKRALAKIRIKAGKPVEQGDYYIAGVPFPARKIPITYVQPGGDQQGRLFPTGKAIQSIEIAGKGAIDITLMNGVMPLMLVDAEALGVAIEQSADALNQDEKILKTMELIREKGAQWLALSNNCKSLPKLALLFKHGAYCSSKNETIAADDINVVTKISSTGKFHHATPISVMVMLAVAAQQQHTLLNQYLNQSFKVTNGAIRVGHNAGVSEAKFSLNQEEQLLVTVNRSARLLMQGMAFA